MKKLLALLLALTLFTLPLVSCKKEKENSADKENGQTGEVDNGGENNQKDPEPELPGVDFLNDDLSEYVEIDEKYYKEYVVTVDPDRVSQLDVENYIIQAICQYKSKTEKVSGDGIITVGDVVRYLESVKK